MVKVLLREMGGWWSMEETSSYSFEIRITNLRLMGRKVKGRRRRRRRRSGSSPEKVLKLGGGGGEDREISRIRMMMEERKRVGIIGERESKPIWRS